MSGTPTRTLADLKDIVVAQQAAAGVVAETEQPRREPKRDAQGRAYATGRRKNAVARVWIKPGKGEIMVNGKRVVQYFARPVLRMLLTQPFLVADRYNQFDVYCTVNGGGLSGQAGAVRHGISPRAYPLRARSAQHPEGGRLPHARFARGRAKEIRPRQGAQELPVQQALVPTNAGERAGSARTWQ